MKYIGHFYKPCPKCGQLNPKCRSSTRGWKVFCEAERLKAAAAEKAARTFVYFINVFGLIKIGVSCELQIRMFQLSKQWECPVELFGTAPGSLEIESKIHAFFRFTRIDQATTRVRYKRELFHPHPTLLQFIQEYCMHNPELFGRYDFAKSWRGFGRYLFTPSRKANDQQHAAHTRFRAQELHSKQTNFSVSF